MTKIDQIRQNGTNRFHHCFEIILCGECPETFSLTDMNHCCMMCYFVEWQSQCSFHKDKPLFFMICDLKKRMCTSGLSSVWWIKNTLCKKGTLYFWMGLKSCDPNQFHEKHAHFPALFFCQLVMYTRVVPTTLQPSGSQALTFFPKVPSF